MSINIRFIRVVIFSSLTITLQSHVLSVLACQTVRGSCCTSADWESSVEYLCFELSDTSGKYWWYFVNIEHDLMPDYGSPSLPSLFVFFFQQRHLFAWTFRFLVLLFVVDEGYPRCACFIHSSSSSASPSAWSASFFFFFFFLLVFFFFLPFCFALSISSTSSPDSSSSFFSSV